MQDKNNHGYDGFPCGNLTNLFIQESIMALVTFSNPEYRDKTVYAVAGSHTETLLKLARENKIPINYKCEDGECGTCLIKVSSIDKKQQRMGSPLTEKEKSVLQASGKLSKGEMEQMLVDDLPSPWRLACQMIVRDEDILVEY
jgi:ferredoxin